MVRKVLQPISMKLSDVIRSCASLERLIGEVYERFAVRFPQAGELWRELATDESIHETRLWTIGGLPMTDRDDPSFVPEQLDALREKVLGCLDRNERTLDDAFRTALDLETLELDNVYRRLFALTTGDHRISTALRAALGEVGRHERKIIAAIEEHSTDPDLLSRAARDHRDLLKHPVA